MNQLLQTPTDRSIEEKVMVAVKALCLVGFPLVPMMVELSRIHPSLPGNTAAEEIASLAAQADRWTTVHALFCLGGLLGLATVLIVRTEVAKKAPLLLANASAAVGVLGAVIFTGTVYMEVRVIPTLSTACSQAPACMSPQNESFTVALAEQGWRLLPGLTLGAKMLVLGLALLAILGFTYGALKPWESGALFAGCIWEYGADTGLHAWGNFRPSSGMPGMAAVAILIAGGSIAWRMVAELRGPKNPEPFSEPDAAGAPPQPA